MSAKSRDRCCLLAMTGTMTHSSPAESFRKCPKYQGYKHPPPFTQFVTRHSLVLIKKAKEGRLNDFQSSFGSGDEDSET